MEIRAIQALEGANVFSAKPVIKMYLHLGNYTETYTNELGNFTGKLVKAIPSLHEHFCSRGKPGGFVERLHEGTLLGHVVEHVALELMSLAGQKVIYGKTLSTEEDGLYEIVMEYEAQAGAMQAARSAVKIVSDLLAGKEVAIENEIQCIRECSAVTEPGPSTMAIIRACKEREIPVSMLGDSLLRVGYGKYQQKMEATVTGNTGCIGVDIACDKSLTKKLLIDMGIPVPVGNTADSEEAAINLAHRLGLPVVIKPYNGNQGKGVALNLNSDAEIRAAFNLAMQYSSKVIVEKYIAGKHYRLLVVGNRVEAVAERIAAYVIGDGVSTIQDMIDKVNAEPERGDGHELPLTKIKVDPLMLLVLAKRGYSLHTVPSKNEIVYLRENANLSTGGIAIDATDSAHTSHMEIAVRAAKIIGLDVAGIDLVCPDISKPFSAESDAIIEVNAAPGIRMHHYPYRGKPRKVAEAIVNHLFPAGTSARIPIVSVTGTNGKTTTTRLIAHIVRQRNLLVGMANSDGIWVGDKQIIAGDTTGPGSARTVLGDPDVEVAVLETARGGILRAGLGYDFADVAVITNISEDHFGQYGIENLDDLAHVKSVVAEAVRKHSYVILNADDAYVVKIASRSIKGKIIFFSMQEQNPLLKQHLGAGGVGVFIKRGKVIVAIGDTVVRVGNIKEFPITSQGRAVHNVQNVLAAVGAAWALGIPGKEIGRALSRFYSNPTDNPGRMNIYDVNGFQVMIDYGHNAAGIEQVTSFAGKLRPKRLIGVVTVPGDRPNDSILKVGMLAGKRFDNIFIREDIDLRGRNPGEVAELIKAGALQAGMKENGIKVILNETEAFRTALEFARPGDLLIEFYEKLQPVLACLDDFLKQNNNQLTETGGAAINL